MEIANLPLSQNGYLNLRLAFFLPCLLLIFFPILGYLELNNTIQAMFSNELRQTEIAQRTLIQTIEKDSELLQKLSYNKSTDAPLFVTSTDTPIELDGKDTEWHDIPVNHYGINQLVQINAAYQARSLTSDLQIQRSNNAVYLFLNITDDAVVYREISNISIHRNDHLRIAVLDQRGDFQRYTIATEQPGRVLAKEVSTGGRALRPETRIEGYWRATSDGYQVELKIDSALIGSTFAFNVADVDDELTREISFLMGSGYTDQPDGLSTLIEKITEVESLLVDFELNQVAFVDSFGHTIAGEVLPASILPSNNNSSIESHLVVDGTMLGILSSNLDHKAIAEYRAAATKRLIVSSLAILTLGLLLAFGLAHSVLSRLSRLGNQLEQVVDDQGRVKSELQTTKGNDAISDLTVRFMTITRRLHQYNEYLEQLSRRLAHELNTPVSVVRSSLENLDSLVDENGAVFVTRAKNGVSRLTHILNSMSEASRIEQSLNKDEVEVFELASLVKGCYGGYEQAYSDQAFELFVEASEVKVTGIPDLFVQMLDKVIVNAVQFSQNDQAITVRLNVEDDSAYLRISNSGTPLPDNMRDQLFDPMVSIRSDNNAAAGHLGLGLYVAKIIAEFHGGEIDLKNREDRSGAVATIRLPLLRLSSKLI